MPSSGKTYCKKVRSLLLPISIYTTTIRDVNCDLMLNTISRAEATVPLTKVTNQAMDSLQRLTFPLAKASKRSSGSL